MIKGKIRPMLAATYEEAKLILPCYVQPKINGIRAMAINGVACSRTLKPLPNQFIQEWFARYSNYLNGFDGELIVGEPKGENVFRPSTSGIMTREGTPDFRWCVFDTWSHTGQYHSRMKCVEESFAKMLPDVSRRVILVKTELVTTKDNLVEIEDFHVKEGYEGIILRHPLGLYKYGRSTLNQFTLVKKKLWTTIEAKVLSAYELMHNENEGTINDVGYTKRTSHVSGKTPSGMLGGYNVQEIDGKQRIFNVGSFLGFDHAWRRERWLNQAEDIGKILAVKIVKVSDYDLPQNPIGLGFRDLMDMGDPE